MLPCGSRSSAALTLDVTDADVGTRFLAMQGNGDTDRRAPLDANLAVPIREVGGSSFA